MNKYVNTIPLHTFYRVVLILFGLYIFNSGIKYNDILLIIIGFIIIIVDTVTFILSLYQLGLFNS